MSRIVYAGRRIRWQEYEKVWVFNIRTPEGKYERRVRNTLRAAKEAIAENKRQIVVLVNADECSQEDERPLCPICSGDGGFMGNLGGRSWFRCQACGMEFSREADE